MATPRGNATQGPVRLVIAARQQWQCSECRELLSSAFEIDHTVALVDGGADSAENATALCPNCHALKTQREHIARTTKHAQSVAEQYEVREDTYRDGVATCQRCRQRRPARAPHPVCWAIEPNTARIKAALARFAR